MIKFKKKLNINNFTFSVPLLFIMHCIRIASLLRLILLLRRLFPIHHARWNLWASSCAGMKSKNVWQSRECTAINASRLYTTRYIGSWFSVPELRGASCTTYRWRRKTNGSRASRWLHPKSVRDLARSTGLGTRLTFPIGKGRWVALRRERHTHVQGLILGIRLSLARIVRLLLIWLLFVI